MRRAAAARLRLALESILLSVPSTYVLGYLYAAPAELVQSRSWRDLDPLSNLEGSLHAGLFLYITPAELVQSRSWPDLDPLSTLEGSYMPG